MRGPVARFVGIALIAASASVAAPAAAERFEDGLAAYQRNDFAKSLKTLRPVAEQGDARAQYLLGRQYQFGQGVKVDRAEAYYWYRRAEAKGHLEAKLFRLLLEKRWRISAAEKARGERKLAQAASPKRIVARSVPRAKPEPPRTDIAAVRSKPTPLANRPTERAKPEPSKPAVVATRAKPPAPPSVALAKPNPAPARARPAQEPTEKPAVVAARNNVPSEERPPAARRPRADVARAPPARERDEARDGPESETTSLAPLDRSPPAETSTPMPPPTARRYASREDDDGYSPPGYSPPDYSPPAYSPPSPPPYPPPSYPPPGYSSPSYPPPYYAPAAPPSWRGSVVYGPRPYYGPGPGWGYRPHRRYMHPAWRGPRWRGYPGVSFRYYRR